MIRCPWCGSQNYSIDIWCSACSHHLDWGPLPRRATPRLRPHRSARARLPLSFLAPVAAALAVAIALALPVAGWFNASHQVAAPEPMMALAPAAPMPGQEATPSPEVAPTADALPTDEPSAEPSPTAESTPTPDTTLSGQPSDGDGGDPGAVVARFYEALASHDFQGAAALWTPVMQEQYPPAEYIDQRFAATQQIGLQAERVVGDSGGVAVVYVDVVEVIDGQRRHWVGTWQLVDTASGWLLNHPNLRVTA